MAVYKYFVSSHPNNWAEGSAFDKISDAREFMGQYGDHGAALTEVKFTYDDAELVEDTRPSAEEV